MAPKNPKKPVVPIAPWDPAAGLTNTNPEPNPLILPTAGDYVNAAKGRNATPTPSPSAGPAATPTAVSAEAQRFGMSQQRYVDAYKAYVASIGGGYSTSQMVTAHEKLLTAKAKFAWEHQHYANILGYDPLNPPTNTGGADAGTGSTGTGTGTGAVGGGFANWGTGAGGHSPTTPPPSGGGGAGGGSGSGGGAGGFGSSGGGAAPAPAPVKSRADWAAEYGPEAALVDSVPELKTLFNLAVAGQWSATKFHLKFVASDWYQNHNDAWRVAFGVEKTEKGTWNHEMDLAKGYVNDLMVQTGTTLTDAQIEKLARQSLYLSGGRHDGIDLTALKTRVVGTGVITGTTGESLTTINALKQHGAEMGIDHSDAWYVSAAKGILHGDKTLDDWKGEINNLAKTRYSWAASQIDAGQTVKALASPYINSMANLLEVDPTTLSLKDSTINKALTSVDENGKQVVQPIWQFETSLRKDPRWATTRNAKDSLDSTARSILQDFGLAW